MQDRQIWTRLRTEITTDEVVVITGPRQVGKTTTLKWLLGEIDSANKYYFDLENLSDRELFEVKNYQSLIHELTNRGISVKEKIYLAIDEIQLVDNLPSLIKYLHDHYNIKFFLSGSSSYYIKNKFSQSMAGRKIVYEMWPLSFQEFLDFKGVSYKLDEHLPWQADFCDITYNQLDSYYREYVEYGGLPKVVLTDDVQRKKKLLQEIFSSYINLDVQSLADFRSTSDLRKIIKLIAARIGSKLNVSEIANIAGLSRITVDNYIAFLEQTYLITSVPAYSNSPDVESRLQKKLYFIDTGIASVNTDLSLGNKFENVVRHQLSFHSQKLYYFSNKEGEIDFILKNEDGLSAVEVKESATPQDHKRLARRAAKLDIRRCRVIGKEKTATFNNFMWAGLIR